MCGDIRGWWAVPHLSRWEIPSLREFSEGKFSRYIDYFLSLSQFRRLYLPFFHLFGTAIIGDRRSSKCSDKRNSKHWYSISPLLSNSDQLWVSLSTSFLSAQGLHHSFNFTTGATSTVPLHSENVCSSYSGHSDAATTMGTPSEWIPTTKVYSSFLLPVLLGRLKLCSPCSGTRNEEEAPAGKLLGTWKRKTRRARGWLLKLTYAYKWCTSLSTHNLLAKVHRVREA